MIAALSWIPFTFPVHCLDWCDRNDDLKVKIDKGWVIVVYTITLLLSFISKVNLKLIACQWLLILFTHLLFLLFAFVLRSALLEVCCPFLLCSAHPLLRARDVKYKFIHCQDSVTGAEADPWLGCHGCQQIARPANRLICCMASTLQSSVDNCLND